MWESFLKKEVGIKSKEHVVEDIELISLVRWLKVIGVNEDKHSGENLVNERVVLLLEEERIL